MIKDYILKTNAVFERKCDVIEFDGIIYYGIEKIVAEIIDDEGEIIEDIELNEDLFNEKYRFVNEYFDLPNGCYLYRKLGSIKESIYYTDECDIVGEIWNTAITSSDNLLAAINQENFFKYYEYSKKKKI